MERKLSDPVEEGGGGTSPSTRHMGNPRVLLNLLSLASLGVTSTVSCLKRSRGEPLSNKEPAAPREQGGD
eukprot:1179090-Pyramimonas_sp.AAC.1